MQDSPSPALPAGFVFIDEPAKFHDPAALVARIPRGIRSKQKLLAILAEKLKFPGYFGHNWDALEESLRDFSWLPADQGVVIVHEDVPFGPRGENRPLYLSVLSEALAHWSSASVGRLRAIWPTSTREQFIPAANSPR
ncbi:MAG: barstar family protein [Pirellulaceae bacterium]|nr:barstar family protein [Pirellulaceae bacterium]